MKNKVFDVTRKQTYQNLKKWHEELRQHCESIPCLLVANKIDVVYMVNYIELHKYGKMVTIL